MKNKKQLKLLLFHFTKHLFPEIKNNKNMNKEARKYSSFFIDKLEEIIK